jgi:predicted nuclease of restriction endonuclease-like (RecB) superfamily
MQKFILKINQIYIFTALPKNIEIYEPIWNITLVFLFPFQELLRCNMNNVVYKTNINKFYIFIIFYSL